MAIQVMELLDEIWHLIFTEHLDYVQIIRCRQVSKRFKALVDQLRPTELLVYGHWPHFYTDRRDRIPSHWIQLYRFELEPNSSFQIVFANLRVLHLNMHLGKMWSHEKEFNLEILNDFHCLEELYVNRMAIFQNQTLRSPNLRVLSIELYLPDSYERQHQAMDDNQHPRLMLESKVQRLSCDRTTLLVIRHWECIEYFQCGNMDDLERNPPTRFKNLRVLRSSISESMLATLENLESLEQLHLGWLGIEKINQLMIARRTALRREVKIYVANVLLPFDGSLRLHLTPNDRHRDCLWEFQIRNYHRLADRVPNETMVSYGELICWLDRLGEVLTGNRVELDEWRFPVGFFAKFAYMQSIRVQSDVENEDRFLYFLSRCPRLTELAIGREYLTQSLLDRLPAACGPLKVFTILHTRDSSERFSGLDLRPIYGLKQLFAFEIDSNDAHLDSPLDLLVLFKCCRYLVDVKLKHMRIVKRKLYDVYLPDEACLKRDAIVFQPRTDFSYEDLMKNLGAIIEQCKELRKQTNSHPIW